MACLNIHKKELACSGIRDRTKFIPIKQMTNMDFMSDYTFLEECTRYVADRKRDKQKQYTRYNKNLAAPLFKLRCACHDRKITLRFLLKNFTKHMSNTTFYDWQTKMIHWRIEWIFPNAGNVRFVDERCLETEPLSRFLEKYFNPAAGNELINKHLEFYQSKGLAGVEVLLKAEGVRKCHNRYFALDLTKTLNENLAEKTIVEFPVIYIVFNELAREFDVIDSDEEDISSNIDCDKNVDHQNDNATQNKQKTEKDRKRTARQMKKIAYEKEPRNFLFADDNLDDHNDYSSSDGAETEEEQENEVVPLKKTKVYN